MAPKKPEPRSALETLDDDDPPIEAPAAVAVMEPPVVPPKAPTPVVIGDFDLQDKLEDALLAAIDGTATGDQHALLSAYGLSARGIHRSDQRRAEEFRLNRLRSCLTRAMAPADLAAEKLRLEKLRLEVAGKVEALNAELAEHTRRIRAEVQTLESSLAEPERKISEAEAALKEIRERAPDAVCAMRSQMLRNDWEPRRLRVVSLRQRVEATQRTLIENDREYYALQGRNSEHPAAELIREMFRAGTLPSNHMGSVDTSRDRQRQALEAGLPALRKKLKAELPGLQAELAQAEADEREAKARCDAPMEQHMRKWLARKPQPTASDAG